MAKMLKTSGDLRGIHDGDGQKVRTASRLGLSSKPASPTMALVNLYIKTKQRDRLLRERVRLTKRLGLLRQDIREVTGHAEKLARRALQATQDILGKRVRPETEDGRNPGSNTTLEY